MQILGHGFLAQSLRALQFRFPDVLVFARGVANTGCTDQAEFDRERRALLEAIELCRAESLRLVYFSTASASVYGAPGCRGREDEPVTALSAYGEHKLAMEREVGSAAIGSLILRTTHLAGPGQPARQILPGLAAQILLGRVEVYSGARRDLLDVTDLVHLLGLLLERNAGGVLNMASGYSVPIEQLLKAMEVQLGRRAEWITSSRSVPSATRVDVARLYGLVPETAKLGFGPEYYRRLVRRYVNADALRAAAS